MAVQAQYPSNVLFLNRNNLVVQQGKNQLGPSLLPQPPGEAILDHSLFNNNNIGVGTNNNNNPRKRGREGSTPTTPIVNSFISMQTQAQNPIPRQLIDLSQLHINPHPNAVSTGLQLAFQDQQQQLRLSNHHQQHTLSSLLSQDFRAQINQHAHDEIQQFLQNQEDHLRRMLADKRQRHYLELVGAAEESAARRLMEKEAEADKASRRNAELDARAAQLCAEARAWQATAAAREATAAALQAELRRAMLSGGFAREETATAPGPSCRGCGRRVASVVLLPCRHLSLQLATRWSNCRILLSHMKFFASHTFREGNMVADKLSKLGLSFDHLQWWSSPPPELAQLISHDYNFRPI